MWLFVLPAEHSSEISRIRRIVKREEVRRTSEIRDTEIHMLHTIRDHTSEFDPRDISANKVVSMLCYLLGWIGVIIALLAAGNSAYAAFHVRQALKFTVIEILLGIVTILLCWTIIVPLCAVVLLIALIVVKIIAFFQICEGKAKEPYIIRSFGFLR